MRLASAVLTALITIKRNRPFREGVMQLPLQCDADSTLSLQDQLFSQIRQLILNGCLTPGTRMPASRMVASDLKVSRNTVLLTYDRLIAGGYLESHHP